MRRVVFLVAIVSVDCWSQGATSRTRVASSRVSAYQRESQMDGAKWVNLYLSANRTYSSWLGIVKRPELQVTCFQTKGEDERKFIVILRLGTVTMESTDSTTLRVKLGNAEPEALEWWTENDRQSYRYVGDGKAEDKLNGWVTPPKFLQDLLTSKTMLVEFQPFMQSSLVEIPFDVSDLRRTFDRYVECRSTNNRP
jgi:hypothetical protein